MKLWLKSDKECSSYIPQLFFITSTMPTVRVRLICKSSNLVFLHTFLEADWFSDAAL